MSANPNTDRITGQTWTIRQVFNGRRYGLDSYQREYAWTEKHVEDLINDLTSRFRLHWEPTHELRDVAHYQPYFLGPIITYQRGSMSHLIDGQQRLTTLMLLLIWLIRQQDGRDDAVDGLQPLVYSVYFGERSFAVDDPERTACLQALLAGEEIDMASERSASVRNLVERYEDIAKLFPEDLRDDELPYFIIWLLERVTIVEITTHDDKLALETFETMNDRGLRLTSLDMLKSFLLGQVGSDDREQVNLVWRSRLTDLADADSNGHSGFVKNWLRAKYSAGAEDDVSIGSAFDKWVRKEHKRMGLHHPAAFRNLVLHEIDRLAHRYRALLLAAQAPTSGLEPVFYNAHNSVTLQFPLILAAITADDDDETFRRKATMVAGYLDIFVARSMVNAHDFRYTAVDNRTFALARDVRDMDLETLAKRLGDEVASLPDTFQAVEAFSLRPRNRSYVKYLLARMTAWLDAQCRTGLDFADYARPVKDQQPYEVEHIWADHPQYQPQVPRRKFAEVRNRFGALLLLPKDFNASFGDMPYARKLPKYVSQNLLARSLHPACYENNPSFRRAMEQHQLPFEPFETGFDEVAIERRQALYRRLCELVWDPAQYGLAVPAEPPRLPKERTRARFDVSLGQLVDKGLVPGGVRLVGSYKDVDYVAELTDLGRIRVESGVEFESPSPAAATVLDKPSWSGWKFWHIVNPDGSLTSLDDIRKKALEQGTLVDA